MLFSYFIIKKDTIIDRANETKNFIPKYDFFGIPSSKSDLLIGNIVIKIIHQTIKSKNKNFILKICVLTIQALMKNFYYKFFLKLPLLTRLVNFHLSPP